MNQKVLSNFFWKFAERNSSQVLNFLVTIVVARILAPEDFGTVALITVFISIFNVFVNSGLGNSLVQKKDTDFIDFSSVFYLNIILSIILYLCLFFLSPYIAIYLDNPKLTLYLRVLGIIILVSGLRNVLEAYVSSHMIFKKLFISTLWGNISSGIVGVTLALIGFDIWALIFQQILNSVINTLFLWLTVKWKPKRVFSFERIKNLYSFGWKLFLSSLIETVYNQVWQFVIGKKYSPLDLAFYNQGDKISNLIIANINSSINSVLFPVMSKSQDDLFHLKSIMRRSITIGIYIIAPLMIGLFSIAEPLIRLLLTEKWLPCVPFLRLFCISYIFFPIHTVNLNAINAIGRSDLFLKLEIVKKILGIIVLFICSNISVIAMCCGMVFLGGISQMINAWPNKILLNYPYKEQIKDILPSIFLSLFMGLCVYSINLLNLRDTISLIIQLFVGISVYIYGSILFKIESFYYLKKIIINHLNGHNQ